MSHYTLLCNISDQESLRISMPSDMIILGKPQEYPGHHQQSLPTDRLKHAIGHNAP